MESRVHRNDVRGTALPVLRTQGKCGWLIGAGKQLGSWIYPFISEIQFESRMHMLPIPKKNIFLSAKKFQQKLVTSTIPQSMCVCEVSRETNISYGQCIKDKTYIIKTIFLALNFIFLRRPNGKLFFFVKQLCVHATCKDVRANILFKFFNISNRIKYCI
jgi:hypothetical protein